MDDLLQAVSALDTRALAEVSYQMESESITSLKKLLSIRTPAARAKQYHHHTQQESLAITALRSYLLSLQAV